MNEDFVNDLLLASQKRKNTPDKEGLQEEKIQS